MNFKKILFVCLAIIVFANIAVAQKKLKTIIVDAGHGGTDVGAVGNYENSLNSREKDVTLAISMKLVKELKKRLPDLNIIPTRTTDIYQNVHEKANIANENKGDLFICIHADAANLKTGRRQIGTRTVTRYKISYTGKGKKRKKHSTPYDVEEPVYEYFKIPTSRSGTSVWIFAAHKTSDKLKAIMKEEGEFEIEAGGADSLTNKFDFTTPEGKMLAQVYAKRYQLSSDRIATMVNEEVEKTGRNALGVNQRQKGIWVLQATNMPAILIETGFISNPEDEKYINSPSGQQELAEAITNAVIRYREILESGKSESPSKTNTKPAIKNEEPPAPPITSINDPKILGQLMMARKNVQQGNVKLKEGKIKVSILDNGRIDNDTISLFYNGRLLAKHQKITNKPLEFNLTLDKGFLKHELTLFAENLGDTPPNTAFMTIVADGKKYDFNTSSNMKENAVISFDYPAN